MQTITLTSDCLCVELVEYLSMAYVVTVWKEGGRVHYRISGRQKRS